MNIRRRFFVAFVLAVVALGAAAAEYRPEAWNLQAREKFAEQRYGVFIVWGLYAYYAQGECYMWQRKIDRDAYERIVDGFYPSKFNAREWVRIVRRSGAKYITITARHCDGFALWPSKVDGYNIAATPFKRDVIGELAEACKAEGIQLNLYYSLMDWHRRDYPLGRTCKWLKAYAKDQKPDYASYKRYMLGQITELLDNYHPGNIWFDCEWDQYDRDRGGTFDWGFDEIFDLIHSRHVLVANNNHRAPRPKEDIQLFERDLPGVGTMFSKNQPLLDDRPSEQCDVIQYDVWGYQIGQNKFRSPEECIALIVRAASKGSNLLLNIGPDASGQIPAKSVEVFEGIGKWFAKNGDSIYGTKAGGVSLGVKVVSTRKDDTLFIHFLDPSVKEFSFKLGDEIKTVKCLRPAGDAFDVVVRVPLCGKEPTQYVPTATLALADPFVLLDNGTYYAYGTYAGDGIAVAVSKDLKNWKLSKGRAARGLALHKGDSYGEHSFWAPEVYKRDGKFVMFYSAEGHVCAAVADSPLGPFRQAEKKPLLERAGIDNSLFVDDDGRSWMVYVHFDRGNTIWLAELEKDWLHVKPGTARMLFRADTPWEGNAITEGPFVVKIGTKYVLTYSGRAFWDPDYAVGYALADKPEGPWRKSASNPILRRFRGLRGTGHHSLFKDKDGKWRIVFHTHASPTEVGMRRTYIADLIIGGTPDAPELSVGGELIPCMLEP